MENFKDEIWKDIPEYEGYYQASNYGRIKSICRVCVYKDNRVSIKKGKLLKPFIDYDGYCRVVLSKNGIQKSWIVSRLIYYTFKGKIPEGMQINHINEIKTDNRIENLNLMTAKQNVNWGTAIERRSEKQRKYVIQMSLNGVFIKKWESLLDVSNTLGFNFSNIAKCCRGKIHTAYGYVWRYEKEGD